MSLSVPCPWPLCIIDDCRPRQAIRATNFSRLRRGFAEIGRTRLTNPGPIRNNRNVPGSLAFSPFRRFIARPFVMPLITVKELRIGFRGPPLLDGVSCQIEPGQRIGLLGPQRRRQDDVHADSERRGAARRRRRSCSRRARRSRCCRRMCRSDLAGSDSRRRRPGAAAGRRRSRRGLASRAARQARAGEHGACRPTAGSRRSRPA